jgi:hypothetical protein
MPEPENYIDQLKSMSDSELENTIENKVSETITSILMNDETISGVMAETNAFDWEIFHHDIGSISLEENECIAEITFEASGEQDEDMGYCGNKISGSAEAVIDSMGQVNYQNVEAEVSDF